MTARSIEVNPELGGANDSVRVTVRERRYPIVGSTAEQLRKVLATLGPTRDGHSFGAFTDWEVTWRYRRVGDADRRVVAGLRVEVEATVTIPQWRPPPTATPELAAAWERYLAALRVHENGHVEAAIAAGHEVFARLARLPSFGSTRELDEAARAAATRALDQAHERERGYDSETRHGQTQGVELR